MFVIMYKEISLCFIVLILATAGRIPVAIQDCLEAIVTDINMLQTMLPNNEGKLYTPQNPGGNCAKPAMECFMKEINIIEEHEDNRNINRTIRNIQENVKVCWKQVAEDATEDNGCPQCESHGSQGFKTFLKSMKTLVQSALHREY